MSEREVRRVLAAVAVCEASGRAEGLSEWVAGMEALPGTIRRREMARLLGKGGSRWEVEGESL